MDLQLRAKRPPWAYQQRVSDAVMAGKNVILQAPTGAGKTRAALEPFGRNLRAGSGKNTALPVTCRYAVPLRALANQFYAEYQDLAARIDRNGFTELERTYKDQGLRFVAEQTGEVPEDPRFEAGLTFCTIDQLLAAFLALPYGVGRRQTNLKVAGVFGSYLVLDEWHLYPLRALTGQQADSIYGARSTTLAILELLGQQRLARFVLMTATFSTPLLKGLADLLGATLENLRQGSETEKDGEATFRREYEEPHPHVLPAGHAAGRERGGDPERPSGKHPGDLQHGGAGATSLFAATRSLRAYGCRQAGDPAVALEVQRGGSEGSGA